MIRVMLKIAAVVLLVLLLVILLLAFLPTRWLADKLEVYCSAAVGKPVDNRLTVR